MLARLSGVMLPIIQTTESVSHDCAKIESYALGSCLNFRMVSMTQFLRDQSQNNQKLSPIRLQCCTKKTFKGHSHELHVIGIKKNTHLTMNPSEIDKYKPTPSTSVVLSFHLVTCSWFGRMRASAVPHLKTCLHHGVSPWKISQMERTF